MRGRPGVGVDIGATEVRVVSVTGATLNGMEVIDRVGVYPVPDGAVRAGKILNPQAAATALVRALKDARVPAQGFVLGMAAQESTVVRRVVPTSVKPSERATAVRISGEAPSTTVPMDKAVFDLNHVRARSTGEGHTVDDLVVGAALQADLDELLTMCRIARVAPRAVDLSGVAVVRALVRTNGDVSDVSTVVDVGATKTTVTTREGSHVRGMRTVPLGGDDITRALLAVRDESWAEADRRKRYLRLGAPVSATVGGLVALNEYGLEEDAALLDDRPETKIEQAFHAAGERIVDEIAKSVDADADMFPTPTTMITLTGCTAQLPGLKERLSERVGVRVQVGRPWAALQDNKRLRSHRVDGRDDPVRMLKLTTAIGLAMWKDAP